MVQPDQILWIEAEQNYSKVHTRSPDHSVLFLRTMTGWEEDLPSSDFHRISRSLIIRTDHIKTLSWRGRDETKVSFHESAKILSLGRTAAARLRAHLKS